MESAGHERGAVPTSTAPLLKRMLLLRNERLFGGLRCHATGTSALARRGRFLAAVIGSRFGASDRRWQHCGVKRILAYLTRNARLATTRWTRCSLRSFNRRGRCLCRLVEGILFRRGLRLNRRGCNLTWGTVEIPVPIAIVVVAVVAAAALTFLIGTLFALLILALIILALIILGLVILPALLTVALLELALTIPLAIALPVPLVLAVAVLRLIAGLGLVRAEFHAEIVITVEIVARLVEILVSAEPLRVLLFLARTVVGEDTDIVIGELEVIFHIHPVAGKLRIARHVPVLFEKLGSVATCAAVDPIAVVAASPVLTVGATIIIPATITATGLTIVDQWWVLSFKVIP
jgi:hypothetical protein